MQRTINSIRRFAPVVLALIALAAFGVGAAGAAGVGEGKAAPQAEAFVPGVTDFPSRLGEIGERAAEARLAQLSQQELGANEFVPGVTDFPSRLGEIGERAAEARLTQVSRPAPIVTANEGAFDWSAGATGAIAATLLLLAAALAVRTARRSRVVPG